VSIDHEPAIQFPRVVYQPDEWVAVFLKWYQSGRLVQPVASVSLVITSRFQACLSIENQLAAHVATPAAPNRGELQSNAPATPVNERRA
jgi:hypothetical protein